MDFYGMLVKMAAKTMEGPDLLAAKEIIKQLKGINAFGTVIAGVASETEEIPHVHNPETAWHKYDVNKLVDVCKDCGTIVKGPYEPTWRRTWLSV
jgi:hypothetical protein